MERELIEKIKQEIVDLKKQQENVRDSLMELDILKNSPSVLRYIELLEFDTEKNRKFISKDDDGLLRDVYYRYGRRINDTNKFYFCLGTYKHSVECDIEHGFGYVALNIDDPSALFRIYINIEDETDSVHIPIKECEMFENSNRVIFPGKSCLNLSLYYKVSYDFFKTTILEGQAVAVKKVLSLKKNV